MEFIQKVKSGEINIEEYTAKILERTKNIDKEYNYFTTVSEDLALEQAKSINKKIRSKKAGKLAGLPISIKDCICVKDVETRAASKILTGHKPLYDATVIKKLKEQDAIILGKTSQDVFGFGSFNTHVGLGMKIPKNPFDKERTCGGSSGAAAGFTQKADFPTIGIAESTGGSIEAPAAFCGLYGMCPTYSRVSRYGLISYGNSLDKIGPVAKSPEEIALMLEIISGYDPQDSTSMDKPVEKYSDYLKKDTKGMKIGIIKETFGEGTDEKVAEKVRNAISQLEQHGIKTQEISMPITTKFSIPVYYLIAMSEASTNLAKYCGMRYGKHEKLEGHFNEYFTHVRSANFNTEAKRRIMLGTFARMAGYRDAYYLKAAKVRTMIINEYKQLFKKFDALVCPTMPVIAPKFSEIEKLTPLQNFMMDIMTVGPNLAGLPHMSVPVDKMAGMMVISDHFNEGKTIQLSNKFEG